MAEQKNILIVSLNIPYPLEHGGAIAQYYFLEKLALQHRITFCSMAGHEGDVGALKQLSLAIPELNVIYAERSADHKNGGEKAQAWMQRIKSKLLPEQGFYGVEAQLTADKFSWLLEPAFVDFVQEHLRHYTYDIIQLEFFESLSLLSLLPPTSRKIYVCHEIRSKRTERLHTPAAMDGYKNYVAATVRKQELALMQLADETVVFTEEDKRYLSHQLANIRVSPYGIPSQLVIREKPSSQFDRFIFIGQQAFWPNAEGLKWFLDEIFLPNAAHIPFPLHVIGEWTADFRKAYRHPNIHFEGKVDRLDTFMDKSVLLSPILSGSGLRTKILHAFANHVPVMSTGFASEGLMHSGRQHLLLFEDAAGFVSLCKDAWSTRLQQVALQANHFYKMHFNETTLLENRMAVYEKNASSL